MLEENSGDLMSIVVLEAGATWPSWLGEYQRLAPNAVVIAQAFAEPSEVFEARVLHRIEEASHEAWLRVRVGVIVVADQPDHDRTAHREPIARALLKAMGTTQEAELVLAGGEDQETSRHGLLALAGSLCEELGGAHINVRVRFAGTSGVIPAVPLPVSELERLDGTRSTLGGRR
jgi:hypothetical protein